MIRLPREFVREVVDRVSIVDVVSRHVRLQKRGGAYVGLCPFHTEKTPSFQVNPTRRWFHCFGCSEGGDAITFVRKIEGLSFLEAVEQLAELSGMEVPREELTPQQTEALRHKEAILRANAVAAEFFVQAMQQPEGRGAREHLAKRELAPEIIEKFALGFAPDSWDGVRDALRRAGLDERTGEDAGLLIPGRSGRGSFDRFRNRLMFPIRSPEGKVVAFGGRALGDDRAKYLNSPETVIYKKSRVLYGLHEARAPVHKEDRVMVVEGYFDVLGLVHAGIGFAVAPCGTALTELQLAALRRHSRNVVLLFDSDEAGRRAAHRALPLCLKQGLRPRWLSVPDGKDPDDFVRANGSEAMLALLDATRPLLDVHIESLLDPARDEPLTVDQVLEKTAPLLQVLAPGERRTASQELARKLAVDGRLVDDAIKLARPLQAADVRLPSVPNEAVVLTDGPPPVGGPASSPGGGSAKPSGSRPEPGRRRGPPPGGSPPVRRGPPGRAGPPPPDSVSRGEAPPPLGDDDAPPPPDDRDAPDFGSDLDFEVPPPPPITGRPSAAPPAPPRAPAATRRKRPASPVQLKLLRLLVQDPEHVAAFVDELGAMSWVRDPDVERVAGRLLAAWREGERPHPRDLFDAVDDVEVKRVVSQDLAGEADRAGWYPDDVLEAATQECFLRLRLEWVDQRAGRRARELSLLEGQPGGDIQTLAEAGMELLDLRREKEEIENLLRGYS